MSLSHPANRISSTYMQTSPGMHGRSARGAQLFTVGCPNLATLLRAWHGSGIDRGQREENRMARAKLDRIDRRILSDLQANGRMTNVELAERAGISAPPCLRRGRRVARAGMIKGYHAELSPEALGYSVSVFALVRLNSQAETDLKSFEELVSSWNEIRECHMLAGEADFLLKIVAETWAEDQKILPTRLTSAPNVSHVKSMMVFRTAKQLPGVPIPTE